MSTRTTQSTTLRRVIPACAGLGALLATPALADLPRIMDHVPADASAAVVINNIGEMDRHFGQFIGAIEMPALVTPSQALNQMGVGQHLNMDGSMAIIVLDMDFEAGEGEFVVLAPTRDYGAMIDAFKAAEGGGGGIDAVSVQGETFFSKRIGEWAAMSPERDTLAGFTGKAGSLGAFTARFGAAGEEMAVGSDIFVYADPSQMRPVVDRMRDEIQQNAQMFAGAGAEQMDAQMEQMHEMLGTLVEEGASMGYGVSFGALGVRGTGWLTFNPGTESAALFQGGGDSSNLLARLPDSPFLFAYAMDNTAPIARKMAECFTAMGAGGMNAGMDMFDMSDLNEHATGVAGAAYPSSAGFMGGLFSNMITFTASKNPGKLRGAMREKYSAEPVKNEQLGMSITTKHTPNETQVAGKSADAWAIEMQMPGMNGGGGGMMFNPMQMVFGSPTGPAGHIVEADGGVYQSYSRSSTMLAPAVEGGSSITGDIAVSAVAGQLPKGRFMEMYIGVRPIMDQVVPFLGMMGIPPIDLPRQMPPIGMGFASRDGGLVMGTYVPAQTIKSAIGIAQNMESRMGGMNRQGGDNGPAF